MERPGRPDKADQAGNQKGSRLAPPSNSHSRADRARRSFCRSPIEVLRRMLERHGLEFGAAGLVLLLGVGLLFGYIAAERVTCLYGSRQRAAKLLT
jgi:hypothetical protein